LSISGWFKMALIKVSVTKNTLGLKRLERGNTYDFYNIIDMQLHSFSVRK